jgi:hypothetical protein
LIRNEVGGFRGANLFLKTNKKLSAFDSFL